MGSILEFTLSILRLGKQSFDIILSRLSVIACRSPDINPTLENMSYKKRNEIKLFQSTPPPGLLLQGFLPVLMPGICLSKILRTEVSYLHHYIFLVCFQSHLISAPDYSLL